MPKVLKITSFLFFFQYHKKEVSDEVDFLHVEKHDGFPQINVMTLILMVKHSQSSQNSKFAMSLQYLKKEVTDFLHADKHQNFLQVYFDILGIKVSYKVMISSLMDIIQHSQSTQSNKFAISLKNLKKEVGNGVQFLHPNKHQVFTSWNYCFDGSGQTCTQLLF